MPQETIIFGASARENIRYGRPGASDAEIEAAARAAGADAFIRQLPQAYDTFLGERGTRLSGGQRQRLSVALSLVGRPRVAVLDELTTGLQYPLSTTRRVELSGGVQRISYDFDYERLIVHAELLGMSLWFAASATSAQYRALWTLTPSEAGWLTTIVNLGFVAGTAASALLNLADVVPARRLFAASALVGAAMNALVLTADGLGGALVWRFLTGVCLAGVYPPAMKMIATWFRARWSCWIANGGWSSGACARDRSTCPYPRSSWRRS